MNSSKSGQSDLLPLSALVKADIHKRFNLEASALFEHFFDLFWKRLSKEDWSSKSVADIAGSAYGLWLALKTPPSADKVHCFNPSVEEHGWSCNGTAIIVHHQDMPFLVDSLRLALSEAGKSVHLLKSTLLNVRRSESGQAIAIEDVSTTNIDHNEALILIEVNLLFDSEERRLTEKSLTEVLSDVRLVVNDYRPSLDLTKTLIGGLEAHCARQRDNEEASAHITEAIAFLRWLTASHFTFLGVRCYDLPKDRQGVLIERTDARLGLLKNRDNIEKDPISTMSEGSLTFHRSEDLIAFSKSSKRSTVHRSVYPDYVVVKQIDAQGDVKGEVRLLGLFTYSVYGQNPGDIPFVRQKVDAIVEKAGLGLNSHDGKNLIRVLDSFPRDEIFQSD